MLFHEIIDQGGRLRPQGAALRHKSAALSYRQLAGLVGRVAAGIRHAGLQPGDRVALYGPKSFEIVAAMFGSSRAGAVFVPINPVFKPRQAAHILQDSGARMVITTSQRAQALPPNALNDLIIVVVDDGGAGLAWSAFLQNETASLEPGRSDEDLATLLYTSGSTGAPKGVMLSHGNLTVGAQSVSTYLKNTPDDRLLCVLPLSFDYGLSQVSTALLSGATAVLLDHLFPKDIVVALEAEAITGLGCVPPLWLQLLGQTWPEGIAKTLRYVTSSGGAMPRSSVDGLRDRLPDTEIFLMYGLTEAFRSTYLDPRLVSQRPDSIGKAIPHARIDVVTPDGRSAGPDEPGELVHSGPLVAKGYWNDPERTAARFRPLPSDFGVEGPAVWSGDLVRRDVDGFLYFVERSDHMIKTSGYRVSPTEVEDVMYEIDGVAEAVAMGVGHAALGQAIVVAISPTEDDAVTSDDILAHCRQQLPTYMVPRAVVVRDALPRTPNGKMDRSLLTRELSGMFVSSDD
ncbi:MAG: acyl-CoA ligase (AMP-forming), exosortase A system-associated [Alphaproteobacteria bacterium]